ncbi:Cyclic AMP receptor protein [bacterium HR23]|nr:Cyclic AMP receptor protein [bacterium HR23]
MTGWPTTGPLDVAELLQGLPEGDAEAVLRMTHDRAYPPGARIFGMGERQRGLYLVKRGVVEEFRLTEEGVRLPIHRVGPGQFLALASWGGNYCCFAEALEESVVGFLSFQTLEGICARYPRVAVNLVTVLTRRLGALEERLELLTSRGLRKRVVGMLLLLSAIHGSRLEHLTHQALAEWAAGSRPKVSAILEDLQKRGLVRLGRGHIEVLAPHALQRWAEEG